MKFTLKKFRRRIPDQELIDDVKAVAKKLGKNTVPRETYNLHGKFCADTLQHRFRSWFTVLELAGLQPSRSPFNIPTADLFKNLEEVWTRLGRQPSITDIKNREWKSRYSATPYICRFGSWTKALEEFIKYKKRTEPGSAEIVDQLKPAQQSAEAKARRGAQRSVSSDQRMRVFMRDGFRCVRCGASPLVTPGLELHCDHIRPWSKGGRTIVRNLQTLCEACNLKKGGKTDSVEKIV